MARIRTIKPEFFTSLTIADKLALAARLTFIGLWTHVDDEGRCIDDARLIKGALWAADEDRTSADVETDLRQLADASLIVRYEHAGRRYLAVRNWREHQRIDKPKPSRLPAPEDGIPTPPDSPRHPAAEPLTSTDEEFPDASQQRPGTVQDAAATGPGSIPVGKEQGTGNREQGKEGGRAGTHASPREAPGRARPRPDGRALLDDSGFKLTDGMRRWAYDTYPKVDVDYETAQFLDHHRGEASRRRNWYAEWQKWIRRANQWAVERAARLLPAAGAENVIPLRGTTDTRVAGWMAMADQLEAQQARGQT